MQAPIQTIHLFEKLDQKLIDVLKSLDTQDWHKPTLAKLWTVKDVATHLLDGNMRMLSIARDNYMGDPADKIESYQDLVAFLNRLNADWVKASKRMSPAVLIELLEITGKEYCDFITTLDPFSPALFSVAWAGQSESPNWFHIAREYTEKWHHQQQIREAVSKQGIMTREFYYPLIDTFIQALPYTYRNITADPLVTVQLIITTPVGGEWFLIYQDSGWQLEKEKTENIQARVMIDPDTAWKLFTKALSSSEAEKKIKIEGDVSLGKHVLSMLSVMA